MKKSFVKRFLSLVLVILMVYPTIGLASNESDVVIKAVYFQDEDGNMVFVDYSRAIEESLEGDYALYNAVKHYVGIAEVKGRPVYLELFDGKVLDYKLAMLDNLFKLAEIIGKEKYEVNKEIKCTHELKIVDGKGAIVEIDSKYTINIEGPKALELGETGSYDLRAYGDGKGSVNHRARYEYKITGGTGTLEYLDGDTWRDIPLSGYFGPNNGFTLTPDWDLRTKIRFTPANEGTYSIELALKDLDKNRTLADAEYTFTVTKPAEKPAELVSITPVSGIEVEVGTTEEAVKELLPKTTTIKDSKDNIHTVNLVWTIENYNKDVEGQYKAIGTFELPEGIKNSGGLELKVETTVKVFAPVVEPEWPVEVESVFVGQSQITENTYANIKIKDEYVSLVEAVYVDDELANNMEDDPSQWRIQVADGTEAEDLKGRISVKDKEVAKGRVIICLWKDKESDRVNFDVIKESFYIKNNETKEEFRVGKIPWNLKNNYEMRNIPVGEYTIHYDLPEGLYTEEIRMGGAYDYTIYDSETNPFTVEDLGDKNNNARINLRANTKLKEIKELNITLPKDTTYEEFWAIRPNKVIVVDEYDKEYEVGAVFSPNKYNYEKGIEKGELRVQSQTTITLPLFVSNAEPPIRKYAYLNITFVDPVTIVSLEEPEVVKVKVGEKVEMLETVIANMSDGSTKEVPVTWEPEAIDTSTAGEKTAIGTVEGFEGTVTFKVIVEEIEKGNVSIGLYKDKTSPSDAINFNIIKGSFYIKNKATEEEFREGTTPWNADNAHMMKGIPVGEYTIHFDEPEGMYLEKIQLGEAYKETDYDSETNPLVVVNKEGDRYNYVKIILRADRTLKEIKPLEDLTVPADITIEDFKKALPKQATIVDSEDEEHQVDLRWEIRPFNFDGWEKPGEVIIRSDFFTLPLSVSNSVPSQRLELRLKVIFKK